MRIRTHHTALSVLAASALFTFPAKANENKPTPFEFHAYGRLGVITTEKLTRAGQDQGDGSFGLPTSRHIRDTNYLRLQFVGNPGNGNSLNVETQLGNLPHLDNSWGNPNIDVRNAYFQTTVSPDAELWFGARRLEFEDVRLFDKFPLSDTTFYGAGTKFPLAGAPTHVAIGFKERSSTALLANNPANAALGNVEKTLKGRDTSLFLRHEHSLGSNLSIRPTLILSQGGDTLVDGTPITSYKVANAEKTEFQSTTLPEKTLSGKVGAVLSHWGDAGGGWGNHFLWLEQRAAAGTAGGSKKDSIIGLASSGDYEGFATENVGLMYGLLIEHTLFKNEQTKFKLQNDALVADGKGKSNTVVALGLQPVYYISDRLHAALDLNHTLTTKVGAGADKPNMTFVTPILRYASNKNALATPQFFTSVTYGVYETKTRQSSSGAASKTSITTQTGCEFWF
ncbi:MAG: hypothetical protein FJY29_13240 [Betaproteobacteria bacterium]|nr:hypothetical protein [Betaproteobacteria bacterium]